MLSKYVSVCNPNEVEVLVILEALRLFSRKVLVVGLLWKVILPMQ